MTFRTDNWLVALAMLFASPVWAYQDPAAVRQAVESHLRAQTASLPGEASFVIGAIDTSRLTACPAMETSLPPGARAWGRTSVLVQCRAQPGWSLYVPVQVRVEGDYLAAARPLARGEVLSAGDLLVQRGDLADMPAGVLTDSHQAVGSTAAVGIPAGRALRGDLLRRPLAVRPGQSVRLVSGGAGFSVSVQAKALAGAAEGELAQARTAAGRTLSGIARGGGIIEIAH